MVVRSSSKQGLLFEDHASPIPKRLDVEDPDSESEEEEKTSGQNFGLWLAAALICAVLAIFCAVYGLSMKDANTHEAPKESDVKKHEEQSDFVSSSGTRSFQWGKTKRSADEAIVDAFPFRAGWANISFAEGRTREDGKPIVMTTDRVADWVKNELLIKCPFGQDADAVDQVLVPSLQNSSTVELEKGHYVGYTRRQVCYVVAQSLLGAETTGYDNFLLRYLEGDCPQACLSHDGSSCKSQKNTFARALWNLLAACAADPGLEDGKQGPLLLLARAKGVEKDLLDHLQKAAGYAKMNGAGLRVCRYNDGATDSPDPVYAKGQESVPAEGCTPPTRGSPGRDFLTGGLEGQAVQDISVGDLADFLDACESDHGGIRGEHERLLLYMPEAAALLFFLSTSKNGPEATWPLWLLGARKLMIGLDGTGRFDLRLELDVNVPLTSDLIKVDLNRGQYGLSSNRPLLAFAGVEPGTLDALNISGIPEDKRAIEVAAARRNRNPAQRNVTNFDREVQAWYHAVALTSYNESVKPAMSKLVHSLGTGPWLSGVGWGDSQRGLLAMWIGHSMAAPTWKPVEGADLQGEGLHLDYYIYSDFMDNPGNQCFVHSEDACKACLKACRQAGPESAAFSLPSWAYMGPSNESCVVDEKGDCGRKGYGDVLKTFDGWWASALWNDVKEALKNHEDANRSIFDLILLSNAEED